MTLTRVVDVFDVPHVTCRACEVVAAMGASVQVKVVALAAVTVQGVLVPAETMQPAAK